MTLVLTREDADEYARTNQYATMMLGNASADYFACRCCILNTLGTGFRLGSEAVEKLLKVFVYLVTDAKSTLKRNDRHNPFLLKQELARVYSDPKLNSFDGLLRKLFEHYQSRYFDNAGKGEGASSEELPQIDDLFIHLIESLPMPDEVKYRSYFFSTLCDANARIYWGNYRWAIERNHVLQPKMPAIELRYRQVFKHLYPQGTPGSSSSK